MFVSPVSSSSGSLDHFPPSLFQDEEIYARKLRLEGFVIEQHIFRWST